MFSYHPVDTLTSLYDQAAAASSNRNDDAGTIDPTLIGGGASVFGDDAEIEADNADFLKDDFGTIDPTLLGGGGSPSGDANAEIDYKPITIKKPISAFRKKNPIEQNPVSPPPANRIPTASDESCDKCRTDIYYESINCYKCSKKFCLGCAFRCVLYCLFEFCL
jgi:hypothetical protein